MAKSFPRPVQGQNQVGGSHSARFAYFHSGEMATRSLDPRDYDLDDEFFDDEEEEDVL